MPIHATECLNAHFSYCEIIEEIFRERYPQFKTSMAQICIGNVRFGQSRQHICDDKAALNFSENPSKDTAAVDDFHAWVTIEGLIIDLTLLYYLEAKKLWRFRPRVIVATNKLTEESGTPIEYEPHKCFTKRQLSLLPPTSGVGSAQEAMTVGEAGS